MRRRTAVLALAASIFAFSAARPAVAAPPTPADGKPADGKPGDAKPADAKPAKPSEANLKEAKVHYERGTALYKDFEFKLALIEFKRAYELSPNFRILYNIGQVNLQLNNYAAATNALEKYLAEGGKEVTAKRREEVQKDLNALKARTAHLTVNVKGIEGADVSIDDNALGNAPISKQLVDAGDHRVAVSKEGYTPFNKSITLAGGDDSTIDVELQPVPVVPQQQPTERIIVERHDDGGGPRYVPPPPPNYTWVGWVVTGVFAAGAVTTGVLALGAKDDFKSDLGKLTTSSTLDSDRSKAQTMGYVTDGLIVGAVLAAGVTAYFTIKKPKTSSTVQIGVGPGAVRLGGSF